MQKAYLNPTPDQTFEVVGEGAYNFRKILAQSRELEHEGDIRGACECRYQAFQRLSELLPEEEAVNLEWNHANSRAALEVVHASAIDHFLINDFEMSAALLELLLDLDPEDHLEGSELLAFDYLALDEAESFDEVINDVSDKSPARLIMLLWAGFKRDKQLPAGELHRLKTHYKSFFDEFTADGHPADERYLTAIESEHPTQEALARELWLKTENLWVLWPGFIEAMRQSR